MGAIRVVTRLQDLDDVNFNGWSDGQILRWSSALGKFICTNIENSSVSSVFGRTGDILSSSGDYSFAQISNKPTTLSGYGITDGLTSTNTLIALSIYNSNGLIAQTSQNTFIGRTLLGTLNRVSIINGDAVGGNPTINIDSSYIGQTSITTLGTIATGTWNGNAITDVFINSASNWNSKQAGSTTLSALSIYNTNGFLAQTSTSTFVGRTLLGTTNQIIVTNSDGATGNPMLSLPTTLHIATSIDVGGGGIQFGDGGGIAGPTLGTFYASSDGVFRLLDSSGGGSPSLIFGSNSASAGIRIKRSVTTAAIRLGDDSGDASISASSGIFSGIIISGSNLTILTNSSGSILEGAINFTDITVGNATTSKHGFLPKLSGNTSDVLKGDGNFGSLSISSAWSSISSPASDLSLLMGTSSKTIFTWGIRADANSNFTIIDTTGNNGTGYLVDIQTIGTSTLKPFRVQAKGVDAFTIDDTKSAIFAGDILMNGTLGTGLLIKSNAAGSGVTIQAVSSIGNDGLRLNSKGNIGIGINTNGSSAFDLDVNGGNGIMSRSGVLYLESFGAWLQASGSGNLRMHGGLSLRLTTGDSVIQFDNGALGQWKPIKIGYFGTGTNIINNGIIIGTRSSGTPTGGLGVGILLNIDSSTTVDQNAAQIATRWTIATHATRTAEVLINLVNNASGLTNTAKFDLSGTSGDSGFWLWSADKGAVVRVLVGIADSGGIGFRMLCIAN